MSDTSASKTSLPSTLANKEPSANKEPLVHKKPLADKEPLAIKEPSANFNTQAAKASHLPDHSTNHLPSFDAKTFLKNVTTLPGVYQMYDQLGDILYVGKAKNLKNRLSSYFRQSGLTKKTQALVRRIASIEVTIAPSEAEALVLEHNLIKAQKPPFNILLRDDKSFPYIFMSSKEAYPRLSLHRGPKRKKGHYFGPFPNAMAVRETLSFLQKTFRVRQCEDATYKNRSRPCLLYQIDRCTGPCVKAISEPDYAHDIEHTVLFLEGKSDTLAKQLQTEMHGASDTLDFEKAALIRDQIASLRHVQAHQVMESGLGHQDVIACVTEANTVCIHLLYVRTGRVVGSKSYFPKDKLQSSEPDMLAAFISHHYLSGSAMDTPPDIVLSHKLDDEETDVITKAIKLSAGKNVNLIHNVRTYRAKWLAMALETARQNLKNHLSKKQNVIDRFVALQEALNLDELPARLECFDISHSSGEFTVGSCVVFDQEGAKKADYRKFNIEGINGGDDYAAMEQVLTRRYSRLQKEQATLPDIVFIDGGKGQLTQAIRVMGELGITDMLLVGIAKGTTRKPGFETLIFENGDEKVLKGDDPALHLIQQIRDEAHRFAITGHKARRDKKRRTSTLEGIEGVGPKRRRTLLNHFGGLQEVRLANVEDLSKVDGISKKLAQEIYNVLHSE